MPFFRVRSAQGRPFSTWPQQHPITKPWNQRGDALSYVISKNLHRRHLNESQMAMVAAKIESFRHATTNTREEIPIGISSKEAKISKHLSVF
jgi:hypothetical protein